MGQAVVSNWVGVICVLLALAMCEATVDSLQNGMAASISGQYLKNVPLMWTRYGLLLNPPQQLKNIDMWQLFVWFRVNTAAM
jgi:hypothetical protein